MSLAKPTGRCPKAFGLLDSLPVAGFDATEVLLVLAMNTTGVVQWTPRCTKSGRRRVVAVVCRSSFVQPVRESAVQNRMLKQCPFATAARVQIVFARSQRRHCCSD